jgi:phosphate transport system substrate-binding protein
MKRTDVVLIGLIAALAAVQVATAAAADLPAYRADQAVQGEIRIWGSPADGPLLHAWEADFEQRQPGITFSNHLYGPESTMAGVYNDVADLAFMAREMRLPVENMAFEWVHRYKPTSVEVANAGLGADRPSANLAVFVNRANPLDEITLAQLDGILGAEHRRGEGNIRRWGEVGLTGDWAVKPIHVLGPAVDSVAALFVRGLVLKGSRKWNPAYRQFPAADGSLFSALEHDPAAIAYGPTGAASTNVKALRIGATSGGPCYALDAQTVAERTYPLARVVSMVLNRAPGKPLDPKVREFLRYLLSRDGQAAIVRDGVYVPLDAKTARRQLERLD